MVTVKKRIFKVTAATPDKLSPLAGKGGENARAERWESATGRGKIAGLPTCYNSPRRAPSHGGAVNLVRTGTKQPQLYPVSAEVRLATPFHGSLRCRSGPFSFHTSESDRYARARLAGADLQGLLIEPARPRQRGRGSLAGSACPGSPPARRLRSGPFVLIFTQYAGLGDAPGCTGPPAPLTPFAAATIPA